MPKGVYVRQPIGPREMEARFWAKVDKGEPNECWLWTGRLKSEGYGDIYINPRMVYAHRISYALAKGPIPWHLEIDHLCRVRACVNPSHLEAVTRRENQLRGMSASGINSRKTHCIHGHPFDEANTYHRPGGGRDCRTCIQIRLGHVRSGEDKPIKEEEK